MTTSRLENQTRILTFSTLYPNAVQHQHGIFVEQRLRHLANSGRVSAEVVAPVPWLPSRLSGNGKYPDYSAVPFAEQRHNLNIYHPRYFVLPKVGMTVAPWLLAKSVRSSIHEIVAGGSKIDAIDAHYFYPDGVAAAILAKELKIPFVITARGTDITLIPNYRIPRMMILWAANHAFALVSVSQALKERMIELGMDGKKITVLRNGVDLSLFRLIDQDLARKEVGNWSGRWILSVGHLIERKGHHLIIEAIQYLPNLNLAIVGEGPLKDDLRKLVERLGLERRVRFVGSVVQERLPTYYSAADALVLASSREGMANVLLESIACGLPVVATPIWGSPEVIASPDAGVLTENQSVSSLVDGINSLFNNYPDRRKTRKYAEGFGWESTTRGQIAIFQSAKSGVGS